MAEGREGAAQPGSPSDQAGVAVGHCQIKTTVPRGAGLLLAAPSSTAYRSWLRLVLARWDKERARREPILGFRLEDKAGLILLFPPSAKDERQCLVA